MQRVEHYQTKQDNSLEFEAQIENLRLQLKESKNTIRSQQRTIQKSMEQQETLVQEVKLKPEKKPLIQKELDKYVKQLVAEIESKEK